MRIASKKPDFETLRQYNTERIVNYNFQPIALDVKLTVNPFLKDQEKYHFIIYKLNDYNKRVADGSIEDPY